MPWPSRRMRELDVRALSRFPLLLFVHKVLDRVVLPDFQFEVCVCACVRVCVCVRARVAEN
jgi:hypothetical protein